MFSTLRKLFCFKEPKTPLGFCDGPSSKRETLFCSKCRTIVYQQPYEGENECHEAVCSGHLKVALRLLAKEGFHVNDEDERNRTALHFACFHGHLDLVYFLLFNECEINVLDDENSTPLMKAVQSLETEIVSVLLDNGADPNIKDCNGQTAIHLAVYGDSVEIASSLLEFGGNIEETTENENQWPLEKLRIGVPQNCLHTNISPSKDLCSQVEQLPKIVTSCSKI